MTEALEDVDETRARPDFHRLHLPPSVNQSKSINRNQSIEINQSKSINRNQSIEINQSKSINRTWCGVCV